jgi:hypothetical protein
MRLPRPGWILVPIASMVACTGTVEGAGIVSGGLWRMVSPESARVINDALPIEYRAGIVYALAAMAFVLAGTRMAPRHRPRVCVLLYGAGAWLAGVGLSSWYIPEGDPRAYQPSRVPLAFSLAGGLTAVLLVMTNRLLQTVRRNRATTPNTAET